MFGYPAAFVAGNLFMGLHQEALILRLSEKDRTSFLKMEGASVFEPMAGRPMREYVVVPPSMLARMRPLADWIRRSLDYSSSIPPKNAGKAKGRATASRGAKRSEAKTKRAKREGWTVPPGDAGHASAPILLSRGLELLPPLPAPSYS